MGELVKKTDQFISLFHDGDLKELPKPFEKEIFLYRTFIAGTSYVAGIEELAEMMKPEEKLLLVREPDNFVDDMAIKVTTDNGVKLGYIPRIENPVFARLMDAGKLLYAKVYAIDTGTYRTQITIDLYMKD